MTTNVFINTELDRAVHEGMIVDYKQVKGGWKIIPMDGLAPWNFTREEALAFVHGLRAAMRPTPDPMRRAIRADGQILLRVTADPRSERRIRGAMYRAAYSLGLKGDFAVTRNGDKIEGRVVSRMP